MSAREQTLAEKLTNYATAFWGGAVAVGGLLLLVLSALSWFDTHAVLRSVMSQLGGVLFVSAVLTVFWDLRGKRDLIHEVLTRVRTSEEVKASGLTGATMDWATVPWGDLIESSRDISVFIAYGSSWRKNHWTRLTDFASKKENRLRLILPDPNDDPTVAILAQRFSYTPEKTRGLILEMAQEMAGLYSEGGADIRIYYRAGDPTYTMYKFDECIVVSLYANRRERGEIPVLTLRKGSMFDFFVKDLEAILKQSESVSLAELTKGLGK